MYIRAFAITAALAASIVQIVPALAAPTILAVAVPTINLDATFGDGTPMAVAYDPNFNQYYGGGGGYPGASVWVWDAAGNVLQTLTPGNVDIRGVTYNANTGEIETVGYGSQSGFGSNDGYSGLYVMGRDGAGLYTGSNTQTLPILPGMADDQSVPAYDPDADTFLSRSGNNPDIVNVVSHADGSLVMQITLDNASAGAGSTQYNTIGFDSFFDVFFELDFSTQRALVFDMSGAYLGASQLPNLGYESSYALGYTNGQLFIGSNNYDGSYFGFRILEAGPAAAPAPGALALFGLGLVGIGALRRKLK
jgi:hypothetical protein